MTNVCLDLISHAENDFGYEKVAVANSFPEAFRINMFNLNSQIKEGASLLYAFKEPCEIGRDIMLHYSPSDTYMSAGTNQGGGFYRWYRHRLKILKTQ